MMLPLDELAGSSRPDRHRTAGAPAVRRPRTRPGLRTGHRLRPRRPQPTFPLRRTAHRGHRRSGLGALAQRGVLGRSGRLRLLGLLTPYGEAPTELRQELRVPAGVVDFLLGHGGDLAILAHDPGAVDDPGDRRDTAAGRRRVPGPPRQGPAGGRPGPGRNLGPATGRPARGGVLRWPGPLAMPLRQVTGNDVENALNVAAALGAILWLRTDDLGDPSAVTALLARSRIPVCLSGTDALAPFGRAVRPCVFRDQPGPARLP